MSKLAIGILTYKRMDYLFEVLKDINKTSNNIELIIVNNNENIDARDEFISFLTNVKITFKYIWDKVNYGVSKGRRKIVENCSSDYLVLVDDDVFIPCIDDIYNNVVCEFEKDNKLGAIAFNIKDFYSKSYNRYEIPHKNKQVNLDSDFYSYLMVGAGMALRVSNAIESGNFSSSLGPYGFEEVDLALRLINCGYKIKYVAGCIVEHKKSPDGRFSNRMVNYYALVNRTVIAKKHLSKKYYISCFIIRSAFFMYKTWDFKLLIKAWCDILKVNERRPFSKGFYAYCKQVGAFLYY